MVTELKASEVSCDGYRNQTMATSIIRLLTGLCFGLVVSPSLGDATRRISVVWNPDCPLDVNCSYEGLENFTNSVNSLLHFVADETDGGPKSNQTVHFLFSTVGGPALLMLLTDRNARVGIEWNSYLNGTERADSLTVQGMVYHAVGVWFTRLWLFNDRNDTVNVDQPWPSNAIQSIPLENLLWRNVTIKNGTTLTASLVSSGDGDDIHFLGENGTLQLSMQVFDSAGRSDVLPRLPHSDIGCQLDVELINIETGNFSQPRFSVETAAVSRAAVSSEDERYELSEESSIDDEYTPGVFRTYYLSMPGDDGFLMWKPVAYRRSSRSFDSFTRAKHGDVKPVVNVSSMGALAMNNVISAYFGAEFPEHAVAFNVTLGLQKDKFYDTYRYLVWSLGIGWGSKPAESLSTVVIIVLIASLALPALALFVGVPYLIIRKRRAALPYVNLNEDT